MPKAKEKKYQYEILDPLSFYRSTMYDLSYQNPYNPDDLVRKFGGNKGLDKYQKMKQDDAVKAALFTKKSAVLSSGWRMEPASSDEADVMIAQEVENDLKEKYEGNFDAALFEILSAMEYGFSVSEKIWGNDGQFYLRRLKTQPPHSFEFNLTPQGEIADDGFKQWTQSSIIPLPREKFILYVNNAEFGNPYGVSDLRSSYRSWYSKDMIIKFQNIFLERFGMPTVLMKYDPATVGVEERAALKNVANNLSAKTSILTSTGVELDFKESQKTASTVFKDAIEQHNTMIMRSILMPNLLGFGETNGGSYALGKVQFNVFVWVLERIRLEMATVINEQLIRDIMMFKYPNAEMPKFVFNAISEDDKAEKAKNVVEAIRANAMTLTPETENYLRGLLGAPDIEEGDILPEKIEPLTIKTHKFSRALNKYEKKVDFAFVQKSLIDKAEQGATDLKDSLRKIRDDFTSQIVRKKIIEGKNMQGANQLEFHYVREFGLQVEGLLRTAYDDGIKHAKNTAKQANFAKAGLVKSKAILWIKNKSKIITGDVSDKLQNRAKQIVLDGIMKGLPVNDVVNKVDNAFEPYVAEQGFEGSPIDGGSLHTTINTNYAQAFAAGQMEYDKELIDEGLLEAFAFSAVIDEVTTPECKELDGLVFGVNNPVWDKITPPIWYNCRSLKIEVFKGQDWEEDDVPGIVATSDNIF